jgi:hypothetical protein
LFFHDEAYWFEKLPFRFESGSNYANSNPVVCRVFARRHNLLKMTMRSIRKMLKQGSNWSRALAAVLLLLFLSLSALSASPALHEKLHSDARNPDHHCAITLLTHGHVDVPFCDNPICLALNPGSYAPSFDLSVCGDAIEFLPPGRGPPAVFA